METLNPRNVVTTVAETMAPGYAPSQAVDIVRLAYLHPDTAVAFDGPNGKWTLTEVGKDLYHLSPPPRGRSRPASRA